MNELITLINGVWYQKYFDITLANWLLAGGLFVLILILRSTIIALFMWKVKRIVKSKHNPFDDELTKGLKAPITFFPAMLAFSVGLSMLDISGDVRIIANNVIKTLILINVFWVLYQLVKPLHFLFNWLENNFNTTLRIWVMKLVQIVIGLTGLATVLEVWGVEIAPILAGLGLVGMAVALAAQDLFRNLLSGMMILSEKRFKRGDWVCINGVIEGTVENIGFRSTLIRKFDKAPVYVPNNEFSEGAVINYTEIKARRIYWTITLEYSTSATQLKNIRQDIHDWLENNNNFITDDDNVTFEIRLDKFNDSSIDLMVYCFTRTTKWTEWLAHKEELLLAIKTIVEEKNGAGFAFPSLSIYQESGM